MKPSRNKAPRIPDELRALPTSKFNAMMGYQSNASDSKIGI